MKFSTFIIPLLAVGLTNAGPVQAAESAESVKTYLVTTLKGVHGASADFVRHTDEYAALLTAAGGDYAQAYAGAPAKIDALVAAMQDDYRRMDSYGYETVEGIVAGVDALSHYDIYIDAGVPASEGPDDVAPVVLNLGDGRTIDREGNLFTYIIEPALWGGNPKWGVEISTPAGRSKRVPRADVLVAAARDTHRKLGELLRDAEAWQASVRDCFGAMIVMTPTLSDYFEDWKESRYSDEKSGRFQAVSRISDMRGIMGSCRVMWQAVTTQVAQKDRPLARSVDNGFSEIMAFLDLLERREREGTIKPAEIDELAEQAKEKTGKLVPQIEQGAAVIGIIVG